MATSFVLSILPPDTVAEAQVTKGPGEARAPSPAAGGVVQLEGSRPAELPRFELTGTTGSYGLQTGVARASGNLTRWLAGRVTLGKTRVDPVDDDGDGWHDVSALEREYAEGELRLQLGRDHEVQAGASWISEDSLEGRGAFDIVSYVFDPERHAAWTREDALIGRREYRLGWRWQMKEGGTLSLKLLEATRHQDVLSQFTAVSVPGFSNEMERRLGVFQRQRWGRLQFDQPIGLSMRVSAGVEAVHDKAVAQVKDSITPVEAEYLKTWSGFVSAYWSLSSRWDLEAGLRRDDDEIFGAQTSPRVTVRFFPARGWTLRALAGRTFRVPRSIFSEVCCGQQLQRNVLEDGRILVQAEDAMTWALETTYQPSPEFKASVYLARTDFDNHILRAVGRSQSWIQTYANINVPEATSKTAELALTWKPLRGLSLDGSVGWLSFHNTSGRDPVALVRETLVLLAEVPIPMDRVPYRPTRTGSFSISYSFPKGLALSGQANYTGGMLIQQFADDPLTGSNILLPELRPTPGFWIVGLAVDIPWVVGSVSMPPATTWATGFKTTWATPPPTTTGARSPGAPGGPASAGGSTRSGMIDSPPVAAALWVVGGGRGEP
ncbi:MAG: TonB-dependent receptor [Acidobacteriota bacterium]|nr:TonB-dependent receptor [Acidobacteriota bacterium]